MVLRQQALLLIYHAYLDMPCSRRIHDKRVSRRYRREQDRGSSQGYNQGKENYRFLQRRRRRARAMEGQRSSRRRQRVTRSCSGGGRDERHHDDATDVGYYRCISESASEKTHSHIHRSSFAYVTKFLSFFCSR